MRMFRLAEQDPPRPRARHAATISNSNIGRDQRDFRQRPVQKIGVRYVSLCFKPRCFQISNAQGGGVTACDGNSNSNSNSHSNSHSNGNGNSNDDHSNNDNIYIYIYIYIYYRSSEESLMTIVFDALEALEQSDPLGV